MLLGWDAQTATRRPPFRNTDVAELVDANPDVFLGFGSVDPTRDRQRWRRCTNVARLGLLGLKLHPPAQGFTPTERRFFPVWEAAQGHGLFCSSTPGPRVLGPASPADPG